MPRRSRTSTARHGLRLGAACTVAVLAATLVNGAVASAAPPSATGAVTGTVSTTTAPAAAQPANLPVAGSRLHRVDAVTGRSAAVGARAAAAATALAPATAAATLSRADFNALAPVKTLDTRIGLGTPKARLAAGRTITVPIAGRFGVPATGVAGVLMTVTVVAPTASGYLSVYPAGVARPSTVTLNFATGQTVSNLTLARLNSAGQVTVFNSGGTVDVTATLSGWYSTTATVHPLTPARLLDTRFGTGAPTGAIPLNGTRTVQVTGRGGVPATGVTAVVANLTSIGATAAGSMALHPAGAAPGLTSLNVPTSAAISNLAIVRLGTGGAVTLTNRAGSAHAVIDVQGWIGAGGQFHPLAERRYDTRTDPNGPLPTGFRWDFWMTGIGNVPAIGTNAVTMNITVVAPTASGQLLVEPLGNVTPVATSISYTKGRTTSALIQVKIGEGGWIRFHNVGGSVQMVMDTVGWYSADGTVGLAVGQGVTLPWVGFSAIAGISPDARFLFFVAHDPLAPNAEFDSVYVRDHLLGLTSVLVTGAFHPQGLRVSADGRRLTFVSSDPRLWGEPAVSSTKDVFWYDVTTNDFRLASTTPAGSPGNGDSDGDEISSDGRYVVFRSSAPGLAPGQTAGLNTFVRDVTGGATRWVGPCSVLPTAFSCALAVSADGATVLFRTDQPDGTPRTSFWRRPTGVTTVVNQIGTDDVVLGMSADAGTVLFASTRLIPPAPLPRQALLALDVPTGSLTLLNHRPDGQVAEGAMHGALLSADGSTVAFHEAADLTLNTVPGVVADQVYLSGSGGGPISWISRNAAGQGGNEPSQAVLLSRTGNYLVWSSQATNLGITPNGSFILRLQRLA